MAGFAVEAPTKRVPMEHTSAAAEAEINMLDVEGSTVGSKRENQSAVQAYGTENTQEPKRPRSNAKKVDMFEQMIDKLVDETERMFEMLVMRLNESDAERNAQHATVNTQLLAMNHRIEDLEQRSSCSLHKGSMPSLPSLAFRQSSTEALKSMSPTLERKGCMVSKLLQHPRMTMATPRVHNGRLIVWQWNCRGFKNKKAMLMQYMKTLSKKKLPDVIALQEPYGHDKLPGYATHCPFAESTGRSITMCILVRRRIAFVEHKLDVASDIDNALIEIIPSKGITAKFFVLNVYSAPSKKGLTHNFDCLLREAMAKAAFKPLLIYGHVNAPHTHWGYGNASPKGRRLAELVDDLGLTLLNESMSHTIIGQGVCHDTTPDLSMC
ncbi:hypothetical protein HPB51_015767 [Rhipicephalus microplus]|uniref:Endonuclease/exonuclease/phosphatase domain-containing protein n=1 Tax=Rhipicephalus microplus TaxID=6941 RepID=A0A9J6EHL6_RHIMP|nr:hypothetical protein HPB51_015767 [Rhipicephalus microplus]